MRFAKTREEMAAETRWEERYGNPQLAPVYFKATADSVQIDDEIYSIADLQRAHIEHPQPASHPLKPHHYLVQEAMDDLMAFYKKYPERKARP